MMLSKTFKVGADDFCCWIHGMLWACFTTLHFDSLSSHIVNWSNGIPIQYITLLESLGIAREDMKILFKSPQRKNIYLQVIGSVFINKYVHSRLGQGAWPAPRLRPRAPLGLCPPHAGGQLLHQHANFLPIQVCAEQSQWVVLLWNKWWE